MMSTVALGPQLLDHTGWEWSFPGSPLSAPLLLHRYAVSQPKRNQLRILSSFSRLSKVTSFCLLLSSIHLFGVWSLPADSPGDRAGSCFAWSPLQTSQGLTGKVRSLSETHDLGLTPAQLPAPLLPWRGASSCHCGGGGQQGVLLLPSRLSPKSFQDQRPFNSRKGLGLGSCSSKGRRRTRGVLSALQVSSLLSAVGPVSHC